MKTHSIGWWASFLTIVCTAGLFAITRAARRFAGRGVRHFRAFLASAWNLAVVLYALAPAFVLVAAGLALLDTATLWANDFAGLALLVVLASLGHPLFAAFSLYVSRKSRPFYVSGSLHTAGDSPELYEALEEGRLLWGLPLPAQVVSCFQPRFEAVEEKLKLDENQLEGTTLILPGAYLAFIPRNEAQLLAAAELAALRWDQARFSLALLFRPHDDMAQFRRPSSALFAVTSYGLNSFYQTLMEFTHSWLWERSRYADGEAIRKTSVALWENAVARIHMMNLIWRRVFDEHSRKPYPELAAEFQKRLADTDAWSEDDKRECGDQWINGLIAPPHTASDRFHAQGLDWRNFDLGSLDFKLKPASTLLVSARHADQVQDGIGAMHARYVTEMRRREEAVAADPATEEGLKLLQTEFPPVVFPNRAGFTLGFGGILGALSLFCLIVPLTVRIQAEWWVYGIMVFGSFMFAGLAWAHIGSHWRKSLIVEFDGVTIPGLNGKIGFDEIENAVERGPAIKFTFKPGTLKRFQPALLKWLRPADELEVDSQHLVGKPDEIATTIMRYKARIPKPLEP